MQLQLVSPNTHKARVALQGPSGSGKTYSALLLAFGLTGAFEKVAIIDTDNAANLYSYFGNFSTLSIGAPFTADKFIDAIELCESTGIEAIIIDSLSEMWKQSGGNNDVNDYPQQQRFLTDNYSLLSTIKRSDCHVICTIRSEEEYRIISTHYGGVQVQKLGLSPIQASDVHYHFNTVLALDMSHKTQVLKDRTSFFEEHGSVILSEELAALYSRWCGQKHTNKPLSIAEKRINECHSIKELLELMFDLDFDDANTIQTFLKRKHLLRQIEENPILSQQNQTTNGTINNRERA